jgi:hypothetical protein
MGAIRRFLAKMGLLPDRRGAGARTPIFVGARLELDVVTIEGTARDLGHGGVFFQTTVPVAPGVRGALARDGSRDLVPVRVSFWRPPSEHGPGGLGLAFEPDAPVTSSS